MSNELLIGIVGLVLSVLTYFAGVWRTEKRHAAGERDTRIQRVLSSYMEFRRTNQTSGLDGLQKAGIATLESNEEIDELLKQIVAHGEHHPLGREHDVTFEGVNLYRLFQYAATNQVKFGRTPIEQIIKDSGSKA